MDLDIQLIKNSKGQIKSGYIWSIGARNYEVIRKYSESFEYPIYSIPPDSLVNFDDNGWLVSASNLQDQQIWQLVKGWAMPHQCFINGFPFPVRLKEMWNTDKSVESASYDEYIWMLDIPQWSDDKDNKYSVCLREVLSNPNKFKIHRNIDKLVDIAFPLTVVETKQGRWLIYDGVHRFVKLLSEGHKTVNVQKFLINDMDEYIHQNDLSRFQEWKIVDYREFTDN